MQYSLPINRKKCKQTTTITSNSREFGEILNVEIKSSQFTRKITMGLTKDSITAYEWFIEDTQNAEKKQNFSVRKKWLQWKPKKKADSISSRKVSENSHALFYYYRNLFFKLLRFLSWATQVICKACLLLILSEEIYSHAWNLLAG